ncbi:GNAT family N-acetyltransferase [Vibrio hannami]|nr:GNAT family N-acetyltransferase [Vibrio hannami]MDG3086281.1 GNAT family N-acetyltransferase [Vibrio hannami]
MLRDKTARILVTAPARKSVEPLFEHAKRLLPEASVKNNSLVEHEDSSLSFISPDELLQTKPVCDLLLVDEASAIPLPMLIAITESYHRVVFSTTVHGYEGCGRGFTLKFSEWLNTHRSGWNLCELKTPIRWAKHDPLEQWLFDTFLLNAEAEALPANILSAEEGLKLKLISKVRLSQDRKMAQSSFALLVAAHYQTSPNDLIQLLEDESTNLINIEIQGVLVGCLLVQLEGGMEEKLVADVVSGKRRPKGHMIASTLATQFGIEKAASERCLRVMRIAIHPDAQRLGLGSKALASLNNLAELDFDYLATSFGVTSELYRFWLDAGFLPVRLGAKRDPASGTHSILMVQKDCKSDWFDSVTQHFSEQLISLLPETFANTDSELLGIILSGARTNLTYTQSINFRLIQNYCFGAVSYESVFWELYKAVNQYAISSEHSIPAIIVAKVLQRAGWQQVASSFGLTGRKHVEQQLKNEIALCLNLQCKVK